MVKRVRPGMMLPSFYGIFYDDFLRQEAVCLPIPLNILASMLRGCWIYLKHGGRAVPINPRDAYQQGIEAARAMYGKDKGRGIHA